MKDWMVSISVYDKEREKFLTTVEMKPKKVEKEMKHLSKVFDTEFMRLNHRGSKYETVKNWLHANRDFVMTWEADRKADLADGIKFNKKSTIENLEYSFDDDPEELSKLPFTLEELYYGLTFGLFYESLNVEKKEPVNYEEETDEFLKELYDEAKEMGWKYHWIITYFEGEQPSNEEKKEC